VPIINDVRDPILIATFLSFGVCLTRALVDAAKVAPPVCARCGTKVEVLRGGEAASCSCHEL
jgi:hypothetical protein